MSKSNFKLIQQAKSMKDVSFANCLLRMREFHQHLALDSMIGLAAAIKEAEVDRAKADAREAVEDGEPEPETEDRHE